MPRRKRAPSTKPSNLVAHKKPGAFRPPEQRIYGLHACLAAFERRRDDLRKVYLVSGRIDMLKEVLSFCAERRLGYSIVEESELERLTASRHHEGVCFDMVRPRPMTLTQLLSKQKRAPAESLFLWLDGIENPHNFGALLRTAAHFGVDGALIARDSKMDSSGAVARVARGGAEAVPIARIDETDRAIEELRRAGFSIVATVPRGGTSLYAASLPKRAVIIFGAEDSGIQTRLVRRSDLRIRIDGSEAVESLNVAASVAVILGEYWRQRQ